MSNRPIDPSTGRPSDKRDHEVRDELREQYADTWRDRDGETVRRLVVGTGLTAFGRVFERGDLIVCNVGDDRWTESLDPTTGQSFLDLDPEQQVQRWGRRMLAVVDADYAPDDDADPFVDDKPHRPLPAKMPRGEAQMYENMRRIWREEEEAAAAPLEQFTAQRWITRTEDET